MRLPALQGVIRRRLLVNFRVDPAVLARVLPAPLEPKLHAGSGVAALMQGADGRDLLDATVELAR